MGRKDSEAARHEEFLREAIRLARESVETRSGGPFGAVVVRDGEIIGRGRNLVTSVHDPTAHAEVVAIRDACRRIGRFQLTGCDVYASSEPCPMCMGAIYWARPDRVFFANGRDTAALAGFDDEFIYEELAKPLADRRLPMRRIEVAEAGEALALWASLDDKIPY